MGSRGACRARPSHAYGPFSTHCFLLHGCTALPLIHKSELENFTVNHEEGPHKGTKDLTRRIYKSVFIGMFVHFSIFLFVISFDTVGYHVFKSVSETAVCSVACRSIYREIQPYREIWLPYSVCSNVAEPFLLDIIRWYYPILLKPLLYVSSSVGYLFVPRLLSQFWGHNFTGHIELIFFMHLE